MGAHWRVAARGAALSAALGAATACRHPPPPGPAEPRVAEAALAGVGRIPPSTDCPPLPPIAGFIQRDEDQLVTSSFTPYRATGTNLYYLQQLLAYAQQDGDDRIFTAVGEVLDDLVCLSLPIARIWAFNDTDRPVDHSQRPARLQRGGPAGPRPGRLGGQAPRHPR